MPNKNLPCPIWGQEYPATEIQDNRTNDVGGTDAAEETLIVDSGRTGGKYEVSLDGLNSIRSLSEPEKARLTNWLVDQRSQGSEIPRVTKEIVYYARNRRSLFVQERAEGLLRYIADQSDKVGVGAQLSFTTSSDEAALAWTESLNWREVNYFFDFLKETGWLEGRGYLEGGFLAKVTVLGHAKVAEQATNVDSSQAFVAMWFDPSMTKPFEEGIRPAVEEAGYSSRRIDQKEHINKIDDEIIAEIRRSRFLVADFTQGGDGARGGVYYEAGFAHALGIPVIFTCRHDSVKDLHFDTNHYNHLVWTDEDELREKLKNRILAVIGEGPKISKASS